MPVARRNFDPFGFARSKVTYHRDVAAERKELKRQAMEDRKERLAIQKLRAQELAAQAKIKAAEKKIEAADQKITAAEKRVSSGAISESQFEAMKARMEREIEAQERHKRQAAARIGNPSWGYGLYQGRGFNARQIAHFKSIMAAETYARTRGLTGYSIKRAFAKNPGCARTVKAKVSDRAKRYRANQPGCRPAGVKKCKLCGVKSDVMVDHIDGDESNGRKSNLRWLCRSCNTLLGAEMARTGQGRRTVQYNPGSGGAKSLGEYINAVLQHTRGAHDEAGKIIHDTPKWKRQEYASEIWNARKMRGNPAASAAQYRLAQAVLSGTARQTRMTPEAAREIIDRTPAKLRSEFSHQNPSFPEQYVRSAVKSAKKYGRPVVIVSIRARGYKMFFEGDKSIAYGQAYVIVSPSGSVTGIQYGGGFDPEKFSSDRNPEAIGQGVPKIIEVGGGRKKKVWQWEGHGWPKEEYAGFVALGSAHYGDRKTGKVFARGSKPEGSNPEEWAPEHTTEYRLGYNLGQADRQSANLRKTPGELHASFAANFGTVPSASWESFEQAYQAGYGGQMGAAAPNPAGLRNPETPSSEYDQAKKIAELFHGRPVKEEITVTEQIREHDWLWRVGPLVSLKIKVLTKKKPLLFPFHMEGEKLVHLMASPDGKQLYLRGGDQELDLEAIGMGPETPWYRDSMVIGELTHFTYRDKKKFHSFKATDYYHRVGSALDWTGTRHIQKTKSKPTVIYDALSHKIHLAGGQGEVDTENLVDGMSPGIVN